MLGRPVLIVRGEEGARVFYNPEHVTRRAAPAPLRLLLFGPGAVHGLNGEPHSRRKQVFLGLIRAETTARRPSTSTSCSTRRAPCARRWQWPTSAPMPLGADPQTGLARAPGVRIGAAPPCLRARGPPLVPLCPVAHRPAATSVLMGWPHLHEASVDGARRHGHPTVTHVHGRAPTNSCPSGSSIGNPPPSTTCRTAEAALPPGTAAPVSRWRSASWEQRSTTSPGSTTS
jgi:hypothetical protein